MLSAFWVSPRNFYFSRLCHILVTSLSYFGHSQPFSIQSSLSNPISPCDCMPPPPPPPSSLTARSSSSFILPSFPVSNLSSVHLPVSNPKLEPLSIVPSISIVTHHSQLNLPFSLGNFPYSPISLFHFFNLLSFFSSHKTIDSVLAQGEKLDSLVEKSSDLSAASQRWKDGSLVVIEVSS
ncbi:hypothetical protein RIF29_15833 [Crotalaria pallida]|uniref:Uncharacterized protein n=1 Tax=Crotalaria pallida TaxID=3830 RepID=A0AAN9IJD9_CROPI